MFSPQAWGVATGRHLVATDFGIACPIVGYGCWWWSLLVICHRCNIAFASHRVTTCRSGQRFLLSVLNGTRLCCCGVTWLLCIRATFCHSKRNVTFIRFAGVLWGRLFNGPNRWLYKSLPGLLHCVVGVSVVPFVINTDDLRPDKVGTVLCWNFDFSMKWCVVFLAVKTEWQIILSATDEETVI